MRLREWDDKYAAALLVVEPAHESAVSAMWTELFPSRWSHLDIDKAPERVRDVSGVWGGLMVGQRMFVLDPVDDPMLFAAWWPWGNGLRFSLRVSCTARGETVAKTDPQAKLRASFGL